MPPRPRSSTTWVRDQRLRVETLHHAKHAARRPAVVGEEKTNVVSLHRADLSSGSPALGGDVVDQDVLAELLGIGEERAAAVEARHALDEIGQRAASARA